MIKVIDIDGLFDKYIEDYVYQNVGKLKPEEIENNIPILYEKFGKESNVLLDGKCPEEYYKDSSIKELLDCLKEHILSGVAVSDYLCEAISHIKDGEKAIKEQLLSATDEEYIVYLMNIISDTSIEPPLNLYLEYLLTHDNPTIVEVATESLCANANEVKEQILEEYANISGEKRAYLVEIISNIKEDERAFDILVAEFMKNQNAVGIYANYLVKYGDERALPFLLKAIDDEKINYADFEELRFAIEALGGTYDKNRDFTADKFYKQIVKNKR